jgi:protein associated with RNAse G/E
MGERTVTVVKLNPAGEAKIQYQGKVLQETPDGVVLLAHWKQAAKDLGYTVFEPGDCFTEYYFRHRWYNIFDIADAEGRRKGWYCNIAEPAVITQERIEQVDLLLDVWVDPAGNIQVLDEDEFAADTTLSNEQRQGARQGLQNLLQSIAAQEQPFTYSPD